jgi:hypothetical protein
MINQGTYENLSYDLEIAAEQAVYDIGMALVALNKALIKNPNNVSKARAIYQLKVNRIAKEFKKAADRFSNNSMSDAYILGIRSSDAELRAAGKKGLATNKIVRGSSLIRNPPMAPVPEIPGQILLKFKGFESHTQFFGVFRSAAYYSLEDKPFQIMRKADDIFRKIAVQVGEQSFKEGDIITRRQISQKLLDGYAKAGLQSITYKNGARHSLDTYCEMLGRTMTGRCAVQASLNRFVERGYSLGIISAHFRSCDLCSPYEGTIVSLDGKDNRYPTIWDAETQGLFHANCYSYDTEVYTSNGWKLFKDVENKDKIFSLNPDNHVPEWVNYVKKFEYNPGNEMVSFKSNSFDLLVTKNHNMYIQNIFIGHCFFTTAENLLNPYYFDHDNPNYAILTYSFNSMETYRLPCLKKKPKIINNYNGMVYCLELEKHHIMLVRRNGKISWCGNCKHDVAAFFEEYTEPVSAPLDPAEERLVNENGYSEAQKIAYKAQEKQRYIERQIRMYKRREAVGLDEFSKQKARNKIKEWQGVQRQHLKNNEFLRRKYEREQIKKAH